MISDFQDERDKQYVSYVVQRTRVYIECLHIMRAYARARVCDQCFYFIPSLLLNTRSHNSTQRVPTHPGTYAKLH